jgi:AcrR family transcriptional regulator
LADRRRAVGAADGLGHGRGVRKSSTARRAELRAVARGVLAGSGPDDQGMADVAAAAGVSNGLLYHYFPAGRRELIDAVATQLLDELCERMTAAANLPFSPVGRLEQVLAVMVGFFAENPVAHGLFFAEVPAAPGDGVRHLAHVRLVSAMTTLMAGSGRPAEELLADGTALLAHVRDGIGRSLRGDIDPEAAWRASCGRARVLFGPPD